MGQTASNLLHRSLTSRPIPEHAPIPVSSAPTAVDYSVPDHHGNASPAHPTTKPSRRRSIRRSIVNFVAPRNSDQSRSSHTESLTGPPSRRRWRNSRRWSKAPEIRNLPAAESPPEDPSASASPPANTQTTASADYKGKAKDTSPLSPEASETPLSLASSSGIETDASSETTTEGQIVGETHVAENHGSSSSELGGVSAEAEDEVVISPTEEPTNNVYSEVTQEASPQPAEQTQPTTRQFPPPGTLVVVQGVVHTTDVPRENPAEPTPTIPSRPVSRSRNRLSALLPRRAASFSGESSVFSSTVPSFPSSNLEAPRSNSDSENGTASPTPGNSDSSSRDIFPNVTSDTTPASETPLPPSEDDTRVISPSSIDVLGTLLSVAAAATAASLLTGSSEPIFSSGLAPPGASAANNMAPDYTTNTTPPQQPPPTTTPIPTPAPVPTPPTAASLLSGLNIDPRQSQNQHGGRERMRQAWGSLRERLGLQRNSPSNGGAAGPAGTARARADPREAMLAEMARAFNMGLGLGQAGTNPEERDGTDGGAGRDLPPEDSFERFLIDLQADLRTTLSGNGSQRDSGGPTTRDGNIDSIPSLPAAAEVPHGDIDSAPASPSEPTPRPEALNVATDEILEVSAHDDLNLDGMPPLEDISDSSDEENELADDDDHLDTDDADQSDENDMMSLQEHETTPVASSNITAGSTSRTERRPGGGINWWRLYRFPPISTTQAQGMSASLNASGNAAATSLAESVVGAPAPVPQPTEPQLETQHAATGEAQPSASNSEPTPLTMPSSQAPTGENNSNVVIPVILVGLRSVNVNPRHQQPPRQPGQTQDSVPPPAATAAADEDVGDHDIDGYPFAPGEASGTGNGDGETGRGRRWGERAANALRTLRAGRRGTDRAQPSDATGSRTFLIYVIGGYYPPDHHIVTGGNALDSFEALWELAELLGQVKPPTVSKEDIEKSGLEIIKPNVLHQYESEGKVASNCVERCLVCLDDYDPEDDLRLLSCRHIFHKGCVDKWLETGRNNCPACRSKGVSTTSPTSTAPVQPMTEAV